MRPSIMINRNYILFILMFVLCISLASAATYDDFEDNSIDTGLWTWTVYGTGTITESSGDLILTEGTSGVDGGISLYSNNFTSPGQQISSLSFYINSISHGGGDNGNWMRIYNGTDYFTVYEYARGTSDTNVLYELDFDWNAEEVDISKNGVFQSTESITGWDPEVVHFRTYVRAASSNGDTYTHFEYVNVSYESQNEFIVNITPDPAYRINNINATCMYNDTTNGHTLTYLLKKK